MVIVHTWYKRANYKIVSLKRKMHWRWLMNSARDWLKIVNRKSKRITTAIPSDHIKRVMQVMNAIHHSFLFGHDKKITFPVNCLQIFGLAYIPFAIRRIFK